MGAVLLLEASKETLFCLCCQSGPNIPLMLKGLVIMPRPLTGLFIAASPSQEPNGIASAKSQVSYM